MPADITDMDLTPFLYMHDKSHADSRLGRIIEAWIGGVKPEGRRGHNQPLRPPAFRGMTRHCMRPKTMHNRQSQTARRPGWLRQNVDLVMLGALAVLVVAGWLSAELVDEVIEGDAQPYDEWILSQLRTPGDMTDPIGPVWVEDIWRDITALGGAPVLALVTLATGGYLLLRQRYRTVALMLIVTLGGLFVSVLLKDVFDRPRPEFTSGTSYVMTASFPSGHSMLSAIVYLTLAALLARTSRPLRFKIYFLILGLTLTVLVGLSRIYLGVHYPTDVLAGWSMGLIWALSCWLAAYFLQGRGIIERQRESADEQ